MEENQIPECERTMEKDGQSANVHIGSIKIMEGLGWKVVKGQKPVPKVDEPDAPADTGTVEDDGDTGSDEKYKDMTKAQIKELLDAKGIAYEDKANKDTLVALLTDSK